MNLNVQQAGGSLLVVSQFTLAADTKKVCGLAFQGSRAERADALYQYFVEQSRQQGLKHKLEFAADMQVNLTNDGPVTFWLQV